MAIVIIKATIIFIAFFLFSFISLLITEYEKSLDKYRDSRNREYRKYTNSGHAGGSGMVLTEDGKIENDLSANECFEKAKTVNNTTDSALKKMILKSFFQVSIKVSAIVTVLFVIVLQISPDIA